MKLFSIKEILLVGLLTFSGCSLDPLEIEEEGKDYGEQPWVEEIIEANYMADEPRLEFFYEEESVKLDHLKTLYMGFKPELEYNEEKDLKYHWKEARELAVVEFEHQQPIQKWENYILSERPRLRMEDGSRDFYRYYEYFILDNQENIFGSILVPTYKRTEDLCIAEVRRYRQNGIYHEYQKTDYQWPVHTEERLEYFYNKEKVNVNYVEEITPGHVEAGAYNRMPRNELKHDWKRARELALIEFDFQKDRQGWETLQISERPRLRTEEGSKEFYRYYEYFVLDSSDNIFGSILIPTYKRTEKLCSSQARIYEKNKHYTSYDNIKYLWPEHTAERLNFFYVKEALNQAEISSIFSSQINSDALEAANIEILKLQWGTAREVALVEFDFQQTRRADWVNYTLSERPKLLLDDFNPKLYRYYEYFVRDGKTIVASILVPTIQIAESVQSAEVRMYTDYGTSEEYGNIEYKKPEYTVERLEYFYAREPITQEQLTRLYRGELPNGEQDPKKLRIYWQDARKLALAEWELQKEAKGWQGTSISETAVLIKDKEGGNYYRYYEFRVLRNKIYVGAIRIPAYRRSENFATTEVHVYGADEKTSSVHPTMWGGHIAVNLTEDSNTEFFRSLNGQATQILTDNFAYNILYFLYNEFRLAEKVTPISQKDAYDRLYNLYEQHRGQISCKKGRISTSDQNLIIDGAARKNTLRYRGNLTDIKEEVFKLESLTKFVSTMRATLAETIGKNSSQNFYGGLMTIFYRMIDNKNDTLMSKILKDIYWDYVEKGINTTGLNADLGNYLLSKSWNIYKELDKKDINPIVEYPKYGQYPQKVFQSSYQYKFEEYRLVNLDQHSQFSTARFGFLSSDGYRSSLLDPIQNANGSEFSQRVIDNLTKSRVTRNSRSLGRVLLEDIKNDPEKLSELLNDILGKNIPWLEDYLNAEKFHEGNFEGGIMISDDLINALKVVDLLNGVIFDITDSLFDSIGSIKRRVNNCNKLDDLLGNIEQKLGKESLSEVIIWLDWLMTQPYISNELKDKFYEVRALIKRYQEEGSDLTRAIFLRAYDSWTVWWVPIFFWPTGWWTVDPGDKNVWKLMRPPNKYAYAMGVPTFWRYDQDNFLSELERPDIEDLPIPPKPPSSITYPIIVKDYHKEWEPVNKWLTDSGIFAFDDNGKLKNFPDLPREEVGVITFTFATNVYELYFGTDVYGEKVYVYKDNTDQTPYITNIVNDENDENIEITNVSTNYYPNPTPEQMITQKISNINYQRKQYIDRIFPCLSNLPEFDQKLTE